MNKESSYHTSPSFLCSLTHTIPRTPPLPLPLSMQAAQLSPEMQAAAQRQAAPQLQPGGQLMGGGIESRGRRVSAYTGGRMNPTGVQHTGVPGATNGSGLGPAARLASRRSSCARNVAGPGVGANSADAHFKHAMRGETDVRGVPVGRRI